MKCLSAILILASLSTATGFAQSTHVRRTDDTYTYAHRDRGYALEVRVKGDVEITDDDRDIRSIERGGYIEIEEERGRDAHHLRIEENNGGLEYRYRRDGRRTEFDDEGRRWFADVLIEVIRESGLGAEARTERILRQSGVDGVLDEVEMIESGSSRVRYLSHMFDEAKVNAAQLERTAHMIEDIGSPGDKARVLRHAAPHFMAYERAIPDYFDAVGSIGSPGDKTRVLLHLVEEDLLDSEAAYLGALETSNGIGSPGDRSRFLMAAAPAYMPVAREAYFESVAGIGAPGDHARVLMHLLKEGSMDEASLMDVYRSARRIGSPGDKARVLLASVDRVAGKADLAEAYLETAGAIGAPGDQARVLIALVEHNDLHRDALFGVMRHAASIGAPGDMTRVLLAAAPFVSGDDELVEAYLEAADRIGAPGDQKRAMEALLR